ncbi:MAG: hypothetical protein KAJ93_02335 [Methanosarcinales archaeon]|nr:hypothetical protein [Methanosarcinales archaeon]
MTISEILTENTDEILAIGVTSVTMGVASYQAVTTGEVVFMTEPLMIVLGYYFGKKVQV